MREIKFRAWIKPTLLQQMIYLAGFARYGEGWNGGNPDFKFYELYPVGTGFKKVDAKEVELMQFTGLLDKNGKEIYEGDIIDIGFRKRTVVTFQDGCFRAKYGVSNYRLAGWKSVEVIGNIYSNPELLKPTNA